jgi:hypothetical protein
MTGKRIVGVAGVLLALALTAPTAALAASGPEVSVIGENEQVLATFTTAKCVKGRHAFHAEGIDGQYELDVFIRKFTGFHKYAVALGSANPSIVFQSKQAGSPFYSNQFDPPYPVPGFGLIKFSPNGKRVGVGFGPAMWSSDFSTAVVLAGTLECSYSKKKG